MTVEEAKKILASEYQDFVVCKIEKETDTTNFLGDGFEWICEDAANEDEAWIKAAEKLVNECSFTQRK